MILNSLLAGAVVVAVTTASSAAAALIPGPGDGHAASQPQDTTYVKQTSEGEVTLEVWPQWQDSVLVVQVTANTHSVDLSGVNLGEQIRLTVEHAEIVPTQAGSLGGHHAVATVVFPLEKRPDFFTIRIQNVPDVLLRILTWPAGRMRT